MRLSLSHPPESRRLLVAGSVRRIISGLNLREPLHARGVDLRDPVLERRALNLILNLAIPQGAFKGDELPLLERLGELREIPLRMTLLNMVFGSISFVRWMRLHACPTGVPSRPLPRRLDRICGRGPTLALGQESAPCRGAQRILGRRACVRRAGVF